MIRILGLATAALAMTAASAATQTPPQKLTLERVFQSPALSGSQPRSAKLSPDGSLVTLLLPREAEGRSALPAAAAAPGEVVSDDDIAASLDILVVEDDPRVLAATVGALEELGHRVTACDDPTRIGGVLAEMPAPDLILSDVLMPGLTGPEMVAGLDARYRNIPVLFVTGFAGDAAAVDLGNRPVLRKPFTLAALEQAVASAARRERIHAIAAE